MNKVDRIPFYLMISLLSLLVFGCEYSPEKTRSDSQQYKLQTNAKMNKTELIEFGQNYARAWSSQVPENVAKFFAGDGSLTVNNGEPAIGTAAITGVAKSFMDAFPDLIVIMDSLTSENNDVRFYWTLKGTNTGQEGTGNRVEISGFEKWTFNDERLVQVSDGHFDEEEYNRQLKGR
jgi:predicted ester cyclase